MPLSIAAVVLWVAANIYLWSLRQSPQLLFLESLGMTALMYPAIYWYVRR